MSDNVIIIGAGFSFDAAIPLLSNFVEKMWEYAIRGKARGKDISMPDMEILKEALKVRSELDGYHGRAVFDDRNIEDILSILTFNVLGGGEGEKERFSAFVKAISTTIELSCEVEHAGLNDERTYSVNKSGNDVYRNFWLALFAIFRQTQSLPTIISLNYDLVLERSLHQVLIGTLLNQHTNPPPFSRFKVNYHFEYALSEGIDIVPATFRSNSPTGVSGTILVESNRTAQIEPVIKPTPINILKLHGSLNFPANELDATSVPFSLVKPRNNPYILPPVSNKSSTGVGEEIWKAALNVLRSAKNVVFVGYSLPKTDMYMQFFLKAAFGPNQDLNRITVFDPLLWQESKENIDMRARFSDCFAPQLQRRINFQPDNGIKEGIQKGSTESFVYMLTHFKEEMLF